MKTKFYCLFLHGIYGQGRNLRSLARRLSSMVSGLEVCLIDLPMHGLSKDIDPPYNLQCCADEVLKVANFLIGEHESLMIVGHSFGGKIALKCLEQNSMQSLNVVVLDSSPSKNLSMMDNRDHTVIRFLNDMNELPHTFETRAGFSEWMVNKKYDPNITAWLAQNVEEESAGWHFTLQPKAMRELLTSYFFEDLWHVVDNRVSVLAAGRQSSICEEDLERYKNLGNRVEVAPHVGHWLHVEDPDTVFDFLMKCHP